MKIASGKKRGRPAKQMDDMGHGLPGVPSDAMAPADPEEAGESGAAEPSEGEKQQMMQTLMDAHEIKNNPMKMKHIQAHADKQIGKMRSIQDLKDYAKAKYGKKAN